MSKPKIDRVTDLDDVLIRELLTSSEWRMIKQRFFIINLLNQGLSIRKIADRANVGTDTVVRMSKLLSTNPNLKKMFKKDPKKASSPKWVFGQVGSKE